MTVQQEHLNTARDEDRHTNFGAFHQIAPFRCAIAAHAHLSRKTVMSSFPFTTTLTVPSHPVA